MNIYSRLKPKERILVAKIIKFLEPIQRGWMLGHFKQPVFWATQRPLLDQLLLYETQIKAWDLLPPDSAEREWVREAVVTDVGGVYALGKHKGIAEEVIHALSHHMSPEGLAALKHARAPKQRTAADEQKDHKTIMGYLVRAPRQSSFPEQAKPAEKVRHYASRHHL